MARITRVGDCLPLGMVTLYFILLSIWTWPNWPGRFFPAKGNTQENKYTREVVFDPDLSDLFQIECEIQMKGKND